MPRPSARLATAAPLAAVWLGWLFTLPPRPSEWLVVATGLPVLALCSWAVAGPRPSWRAWVVATWEAHALALALLYAFGVQFSDAHGITTDGVTYFTQLRSVIFDGDLDVDREFGVLGQPPRPNHVVPIGPVLVWLPLYLVVAAVDAVGRFAGAWATPADRVELGLGLPYVRAALVSSFGIGAVGLGVLGAFLRRQFPPAVTLATLLLVFGATPLYWYMVYEPSMTHAASFGFVSIFVVLSATWVPRGVTRREAALLGTVLGLAFLARSQDALFALLPGVLVLTLDPPARAGGPRRSRVGRAVFLATWALVGFLPWLLLQLGHSYVLFAKYQYALVGPGGYLDLRHSSWLDTLFSSWHGFLSWTPVAYVAVVGLVFFAVRDWRWTVAALAILFVQAWVNGATQDWPAGWSFGGRRFISVLVVLAPGLACVVDTLVRRPLMAVAPLVAVALYANHLLMVQYTTGMLPKDEPVSFGRIVRQQSEVVTRPPFFYPFAFPANAWFAWREGLAIDKYDLLGPERPRESFDALFDRRVEKFLTEGWDTPGGDDFGTAWWIGGTPASLVVPLAPAAGRGLRIIVMARTRLDEPVMRATLAVDLNGTEVGRFDPGVPGATTSTIDVPAADAARLLKTGFNRVSFRSVGVTRVDPSDTRPPGPLAGRRGVWPVAVYRLAIAPSP